MKNINELWNEVRNTYGRESYILRRNELGETVLHKGYNRRPPVAKGEEEVRVYLTALLDLDRLWNEVLRAYGEYSYSLGTNGLDELVLHKGHSHPPVAKGEEEIRGYLKALLDLAQA